jgi:hypothetical protein
MFSYETQELNKKKWTKTNWIKREQGKANFTSVANKYDKILEFVNSLTGIIFINIV